jgi:signal transduction histidine kinase
MILYRLREAGKRIWTFAQSIRFQLTLWSVAILAVILLIFSAFVYLRQSHDLQIDTENQLQIKTQQLELLYRVSGAFDTDNDHFQAPNLNQDGSALLQDKEMLAIVDPTGKVLQKAGKFDASIINKIVQYWQATSQSPAPVAYSATMDPIPPGTQKQNDVFIIAPLFVERHWVGLIILGRPVDPDGQLSKLLLTLSFGSLATLGLALTGGYWLAGRAMAPVRAITRTARGISETDLSKRLRLKTQDELGELADTFDDMLDRLQAAFNRQRQFTADASHELRTPLTIIGLTADQALARKRTSEEYQHSMVIIKSENEYMSRLVNDLLTLARMDAGQTQLKFEPIDIGELTLDVVERLAPLALRDEIELHVEDFPEAFVNGDRQYLSQMLTNLVENAIKYAGGKGHNVWVETGSKVLEAKNFAWVRVKDDGPGIPAKHLPHLFDRFYRVDQARTRTADESAGPAPDGIGLGLSIVHWVVQAHQGKVIVESKENRGSTFEVLLPCISGTKHA